jgi:hypothetical protein
MLKIATRKAAARGVGGRVTLAHLDLNDLPDNGALAGPFGAVLANFGSLNCVTDRRALAAWLAPRVGSGAHVVLTVMGPLCPWEHVALAITDPANCLRRWRRDGVLFGEGPSTVLRVLYPSPRRLAAEFAPWFDRVRLTGLGVLIPPTRWHDLVERRPSLLRFLGRTERAIAGRWPATWLNDHYVLELRRRG